MGIAVGWLAVQGLQRTRLDSTGLYPVATLATAAVAFGAADTLHGSGFLAVYVAGLVLGSARIPAKRTVTVFHQGLAWVAQIAMFLALGLLVFPSQLDEVAVEGTVAGAGAGVGRSPAGDVPRAPRLTASRRPSGWCSAGPGCAARCRWCWRRSR